MEGRSVKSWPSINHDSGAATPRRSERFHRVASCGWASQVHQRKHRFVDKMTAVNTVKVPAHGSISFASGGYHLTCMSPSAAMMSARSVPMTLTFTDGESATSGFAVREPGAT